MPAFTVEIEHLLDLRHHAATRFWKEYKDVALVQQFLGDRDVTSAMHSVNINGKEPRGWRHRRRARPRGN
jgi:hypothetical protein